MRKAAHLLFLLLFPLWLTAEHVHWLGDYSAAHKQALHEQKTLLVLVTEQNSSKTASLLKTFFMDRPYVG